MKELCSSKCEQEITEQEVCLLQQQIAYYNSSNQSFDNLMINESTFIETIQDSEIRQQLLFQYRQIAEESRKDMFDLSLTSAKLQMSEAKYKFNQV